MSESDIISLTEDLGLSNKQSRTYVACLKLGPSQVQRIADKSGVKRVTTYVVLESLIGLGLISQVIKGKKTLFVAEDPINLERLVKQSEQELSDQKKMFAQILPQLEGLKSVPFEAPEVRFYEGAGAIQSIFSNFFSNYKGPARDIYIFSNLDQVMDFFPERRPFKPNLDRMRHNVRAHLIYTCKEGPIYGRNDAKHNRESRFIPEAAYPITGDISIIRDHVILLSYAESKAVGVTIRNAEIAQAMKVIFDMCWKFAENYQHIIREAKPDDSDTESAPQLSDWPE